VLKGLVENGDKLVQSIMDIADQNGIRGVKTAQSGVALEFEFAAQEVLLKKTSVLAKKTEKQIIEIFKLYTGETFEHNVEYPMEFTPRNTMVLVSNFQSVLDMGVPPKASALLKEAAFNAVASELDKEKVRDAAEEFAEQATETKLTNQFDT